MSSQEYITLNNGQKMPQVGFGTYEENSTISRDAINVALEYGYRSIDTAFMYLNEEGIGEVLHKWLSSGKIKREELFITTKLPAIGNRTEDVSKFLTKSLKRLRLDYVDLYLVHHPFGLKYFDDINVHSLDENERSVLDFETDHESVWKAMENEVKGGRTKAIGLSNFNSIQIERILKYATIPPAVHQIEIHCYFQQKKMVEFCQERGIAVTAYGPLGAPWTKEGQNITPKLLEHPVVLEIGKKHGKSAGQILLKFLVERNIIVIPKSVTPARIKSNFDLFDFNLSDQDMEKLYSLDKGKEGRAFHFTEAYKGCEKHKEYPFHIEF